MQRQLPNRLAEMEVFVRATESGSFSAAARACRMTPSAVSKQVARLEARLGARLFLRSTRRLDLTEEGRLFYERSRAILDDLREVEQIVAKAQRPAGRLRVNVNVPFGRHYLLPLVPGFLARYPAVSLDLTLTDTVVDLVAERADVAVRAGPMPSSALVARKLGETRKVIVGAPDYLARAGVPRTADDLERHRRIEAGYPRAQRGWPLRDNGRMVIVPPSDELAASDGEALRALALAGAGLARLALFQVRNDIAAGRLVPVLEALNPGDTEAFHTVFVGPPDRVPARVRAFIDFLWREVRVG